MKISVLTATYNRADKIEKLYNSLIINQNANVDFEWLIMDDGSTDKTKLVIDNYKKQNIIDIKYYHQENRGKMSAINQLVKLSKGDLILVCDSDDYLTNDAFQKIKNYSKSFLQDETVYAMVFLKRFPDKKISGKMFKENAYKSDMFSLYFKERMTGEKALVFKADIRKKYNHDVVIGENFITESRMYHKMDQLYDVLCINETIEIVEYQKNGYSKNINKIFKENPKGYYLYFKEIMEMDFATVTPSKRLYVYKHYILFSILSGEEHPIKNVNGIFNKIMISILWIPGKIKTKRKFGVGDNKK